MVKPGSVLITGCSTGFGKHTAVRLAERGWRVFATMRNPDKRAAVDEAARAAGPAVRTRLEVLRLDVTDPQSVNAAVDQVLDATGGTLDAVVNNAGIGAGGTFEDLPDDEIRRVMETNYFGVLNVTRAVLPLMREQRHGRIVIVSSEAAFRGTPGLSAYVASKWAIEGWAESVSLEVEPFGVHISCVEPGAYATEIWESSPRFLNPDSGPYAALTGPMQRFLDTKVIPRARDPKEVADTIAKALESKRPWFRYPVGPDAVFMAVARGIVPHRAVSIAVRRVLGVRDGGR